MVHGFLRTSLMWRYVAPQFASNQTVICVGLQEDSPREIGQAVVDRLRTLPIAVS
jgi:hypothetical protein